MLAVRGRLAPSRGIEIFPGRLRPPAVVLHDPGYAVAAGRLPSSCSRLAILGAPGRPFSSPNTRLISIPSNRFDCSLAEGGLRFHP